MLPYSISCDILSGDHTDYLVFIVYYWQMTKPKCSEESECTWKSRGMLQRVRRWIHERPQIYHQSFLLVRDIDLLYRRISWILVSEHFYTKIRLPHFAVVLIIEYLVLDEDDELGA